jgi:hypothetical protein
MIPVYVPAQGLPGLVAFGQLLFQVPDPLLQLFIGGFVTHVFSDDP